MTMSLPELEAVVVSQLWPVLKQHPTVGMAAVFTQVTQVVVLSVNKHLYLSGAERNMALTLMLYLLPRILLFSNSRARGSLNLILS